MSSLHMSFHGLLGVWPSSKMSNRHSSTNWFSSMDRWCHVHCNYHPLTEPIIGFWTVRQWGLYPALFAIGYRVRVLWCRALQVRSNGRDGGCAGDRRSRRGGEAGAGWRCG